MLKGTKKRRDVVVDNLWRAPIVITNDSPHPGERPHFTMPGAEDLLRDLVWRRAQVLYGTPLPCPLFRRLNTEWLAICQNGHASLYWLAHLLVQESEQNGYHTEPYGSAGSSFVAFLAGITHINPLPPHYRCPQCRYTEFSEAAACGYDLPEKLCPRCKTVLERDGQVIGNIMYTKAKLTDENGTEKEILTFGPVSVLPEYQRNGYGKLLINHSCQKAAELGFDVIVILGSPANYVSCGFQCCKKYNVCVEGGKYPAAMLVKELKEGALDGRKWYYSESPAMNIDEQAAVEFDDQLEPMEKKWTPSQEAFYIMSNSFVE